MFENKAQLHLLRAYLEVFRDSQNGQRILDDLKFTFGYEYKENPLIADDEYSLERKAGQRDVYIHIKNILEFEIVSHKTKQPKNSHSFIETEEEDE